MTFPSVNGKSQWNLSLWGRAFKYADYINNGTEIINLQNIVNLQNLGNIKLYLTQNPTSTKIRVEVYVDVYGDKSLISTYFSDYIDKPSNTDNMLIQLKCDMDWFDLSISKVTT